jgi:hypothetical protein
MNGNVIHKDKSMLLRALFAYFAKSFATLAVKEKICI